MATSTTSHRPQGSLFVLPRRGRLARFAWVLVFSLAVSAGAVAQIGLPSATPVATNFNAAAGSALPANWKLTNGFTLTTNAITPIGNNTLNFATVTGVLNGMAIGGPAASNIPAGAAVNGSTATTVTMSANATAQVPSGATVAFSNGNTPTWTSTANVTSANTATTTGSATGNSYAYTSSVASDRAFGFQNSTSFLTPQSIMAHYRNTSLATMTDLSISYTMERYRVNTAAASVDFYYSLDGATWVPVAAGNIVSGVFAPGAASFTFTDGTQTKVSRTAAISGLSLAPNGNIYIRWNVNLANANSQGLGLDDVSATATFLACSTPTAQPTGLTFNAPGTGQISGSFTAASPAADGYLVVRYPAGSAVTNPTDGFGYSQGSPLGLGTVVSAGTSTSFIANGLTIATNYDFYVYSFNSVCTGGPKYRTASPLPGTQATAACPTFASTISIDPSALPNPGITYQTLTDALLDLSGCSISQPIIIELESNYTSAGETFPLVLPAISGASSTNTITIRPATGAFNLTISGNSTVPFSQGSIFYINGGSYWRIDGRIGSVGTTRNLTIENTDNTSGSAAVRFINGAQNNVLTYCNVKSANTGAASGTVNFSTSTTVGNSNNIVTNCAISNASTGTPNVGLSSVGSAGFSNDNNQILNNNIFDFFTASQNSYGIYISDNTANWTISGNSIYQTATRTQTSGADRNWAGIYISPGVASTVNGLNITGNYIGGTAPLCGGSALTLNDNGTGNIVFRGIFGQVGTATPTSIQDNTIQNITVTSSSTSSNQSLISAVTGSFNIGTVTGNTLGAATGTNSVTLTQTTTSTAARLSGIIAGVGTPGAISIQNNTIGGLSVSNSSSGTASLAGIYATGAATSYTISGNTVGSLSTSGSLKNNTNDDTWGIFLSSSTVSNSVTGNTVANLNSGIGRHIGIRADGGVNTITGNSIYDGLSASTQQTGLIGIWMNSGSGGQTVSQNTIHTLSNTDASAGTFTHGIYWGNPASGTNNIERNLIHSLSLATSATSGALYGIRILTGTLPVNINNNMVRLGIDASGASLATGYAIFGIGNASTGAINHYNNTIYIGGTATGTTSNTYALNSSGPLNTRVFQNNLLVNARTGGATGSHYAMLLGGTGANPAGLTVNYNLYYAPGTNGILVSYSSTNYDDLPSIRTAIGQDLNSVSCDPKLIAPTANAAGVNLHIQAASATLVEGTGVTVGSVLIDFDGQTRSGLTPNDIGADAGNFTPELNGCAAVWTGATDNTWTTASNWAGGSAPSSATPVLITGGPSNQPSIASGTLTVASLTLQGTGTLTIASGAQLNVSGAVSSGALANVVGAGIVSLKGLVQQNVTGTVNVSNLEIANTSVGGVVVPSGSTLNIKPSAGTGSGVLSFLTNGKLTNNGALVLKSNALATASLAAMPSGATLTGNLTLERRTPSTTGWYFVSAPFSSAATLAQWSEAGVRVSPKNNANVFEYNETDSTRGTYNNAIVERFGWKVPSSTGNAINPGNSPKGYRLYLNSSFISGGATLSVTGAPLMQNVTKNYTFTPAAPGGYDGGGWNLIANPYPCAIDWNAVAFDASNGTGAGASGNAINTYNPVSQTYATWTATGANTGVAVNGGTRYVASSQAFFIKAAAPGTLTFKETHKNTANGNTFLRMEDPENTLRLAVMQNGRQDEAVITFLANGRLGKDAFDAENVAGEAVDIATGASFAINVMPALAGRQAIPVQVSLPESGSAVLSFSGMETFSAGYNLYLVDDAANTRTDLRRTASVQVNGTAGTIQGRFGIVIEPATATGLKSVSGMDMVVWPNPVNAAASLNITLPGLANSAATLELVDALGRVVTSENINIGEAGFAQLSLNKVPAGHYRLRASGRTGVVSQPVLVQ